MLPLSENLDSHQLAQFLRSGPVRPIIDRLLKTVVEVVRTEFVSLGVHSDTAYHFISTHGFPFSMTLDSLPAEKFKNEFNAKAIEIPDLHAQPGCTPLESLPVAKTWRYVANMPIRLDRVLSDDGVIALSVADRKPRDATGSTLIELSRIAAHIADVVWLARQLHSSTISSEKSALASRVLIDGLRQTSAPMGLVDSDLNLLEFSPGLAEFQNEVLGSLPSVGQSLFDVWIDKKDEAAVRSAINSDKPFMEASSYLIDHDRPIIYDFHGLSFPDAKLKVGVFSIRQESLREFRNAVNEPRADGVWTTANRFERENTNVVGDFLFETLREHKRLRQRKGHSYIALRSWRKAIKPHQLSALKALKRHGSENFIGRIASEMLAAIEAIHGKIDNGIVVPVPCGHSGPGCLAEKLAEALANLMGLRAVKAFEHLKVKGSSHPRTNSSRPRMKLHKAPTERVILVDDVATSGAHIEEARSLLARSATAVWPIVWVAD